jgi:transcriptional antiterminator RfaH
LADFRRSGNDAEALKERRVCVGIGKDREERMQGLGWTTDAPMTVAPAPMSAMTAMDMPYPATLETGEKWSVLYVKSRQEKALADELAALGIRHFLPLIQHKRLYGKRKATVELPLFPGYLFLHGNIDEVYRADRTRRVSRIIPVVDQARLNWELRNIDLALAREATLDPFPFLVAGTRVEVRSGPLVGLQGVVEKRSKGDRLILQVDILGQATIVDIDGAELAVLE